MTEISAPPPDRTPRLRPIEFADIRRALSQGWRDFLRAPHYGLFFGGFYVLGGFAMLAFLTIYDAPWMIVPLAIGFPLLGPFVAVGLYEVSRRLARGEPLDWSGVLAVIFRQKDRQLAWMAFVVLFVFWIWAYQIRLLLALTLGLAPIGSLDAFLTFVATTPEGWTFLGVGAAVGAALSLALFSITVIAMPLLVDREVDMVTAMIASVGAVRRNPGPMLSWGLCIAALTLVALAPAFLGLLVVLPVLGHATWRLYDNAVIDETAALSP